MKKIFVLVALFIFLFSGFVSAQAQGQGVFDGTGGLIQSLFALVSTPITLPHLIDSVAAEEIPLWVLVLGFMIAFSVIHLAAGRIPLFKEAKGPHKMFSIAVSLMVIFSTPFLVGLLSLVGTFTSLGMIAVFVLGIYTIWTLFKGGWSQQSKDLAESNQMSAEAKEMNMEAKALKDSARAGRKGLDDQKRALRSLVGDRGVLGSGLFRRKGAISLDVEHNKRLLNQLDQLSEHLGQSGRITGEREKALVKGMLKELASAVGKLKGKTQQSANRLGRINKRLEDAEREEINTLNKILELIKKDIEDVGKSDALTEEEQRKIIDDLNGLKDNFERETDNYIRLYNSIKKLKEEILNIEDLKIKAAGKVHQSILAGTIPPDSAGHIQELRNVIAQELSLESQLTNELEKLDGLSAHLKNYENQLEGVASYEKKKLTPYEKGKVAGIRGR